MGRVDFEQGSAEWLDWRLDGIGGSDAAAILGKSRFKSRDSLLKEKRFGKVSTFVNEAMRRGKMMEPIIDSMFIRETGVFVESACYQSDEHDWLRVSLDGISPDERIIAEYKAPMNMANHDAVFANRSVPEEYWIQMQHAFAAIPSAESGYYVSYHPESDNPLVILPVARDDEFIQELLAKERAFWNEVKSEEFLEPDSELLLIEDDLQKEAMQLFLEADDQAKYWTRRKGVLKDEIVEFVSARADAARIANCKVARSVVNKPIDWKAYCAALQEILAENGIAGFPQPDDFRPGTYDKWNITELDD